MKLFEEAEQAIIQANGALSLWSKHYGSTTDEFGQKRNEIIEVLRAKVKGFQNNHQYGEAIVLGAYIDGVEKALGPVPEGGWLS